MIAEDAQNIMKAAKGILLVFDYNEQSSIKGDYNAYKVSDKLSYYGLSYKMDDQVFKIYLKTGPTKK